MSSEVDYMGFANLPNQLHRKNVKKGFEFTLMVVGESGLGKSTLINALFKNAPKKDRKVPTVQQMLESTLKIETNSFEMEECGVRLKITVVDTPGFGASLNSNECWKPIIDYIDEQFENPTSIWPYHISIERVKYGRAAEKYLNHESGLNRRQIADTRIHSCLYFISPESYGLKPLDVLAMKALQSKVNLIPIIGKSDFLTKDEMDGHKKRILEELKSNGIQIYSIPECDTDEDEEYREHIRQLKTSVPFAVSSSLEFHEVKGRKVRGRAYPWGIVETENPEHSDFVKLRAMIVSHLQDLREVTNELHYENYRTNRLVTKTNSNSDLSLRDNISITSDDRDRTLQEKEAEIRRMQEMIERMQKEMLKQNSQQLDENKENSH